MKPQPVRLLGLPVEVHRRAAEHVDAVHRELALIEAADDHSVPARLRALSERLRGDYAELTAQPGEELQAALDEGREAVDLTYHLPPTVVPACEELGRLLEELDDYCRGGDLLSLVTPPEGVAYRRWFLGEFVRQLRDGAAPQPWPGFGGGDGPPAGEATAASAAATGEPAPGELAVVEVEGDLDLQSASQLRAVVAARFDEGRRSIVFDLTGCHFIDSVGLSLILTTRTRCIERGGTARVRNAQPFVQSTFRYAGVLELLAPGDT